MPDEMPRRRTNLHDPRQREWEEREEGEPSRMSFTGFQIVVCILCILAAVGVRLAGGGTYTKVQAAVSQALENRDVSGQFRSAFHAIKAYFPDMKEVFQSAVSDGSQVSSGGAASGGSSGASAASAGQTSAGSAASQTASQASSAASTATTSRVSVSGVTEFLARGEAA